MMTTSLVWSIIAIGWFGTVPLARPILRRSGPRRLVAYSWLAAASGWAVCASLGWRPIGFSPALVLLTAAHFTHAGFGVSVLLLAVGARRAFWVHQAAMVVVAAGLTAALAPAASSLHRLVILQPIGAHVLVGTLTAYSVRAWSIRPSLTGWRRSLLTVSAVVWCYPMLIAVSWAFDRIDLLHPVVRGIDSVIAQHGAVNAIALVLFGVAALRPEAAPAFSSPLNATTPLEVTHAHAH